MTEPSNITVVGADGIVGRTLAAALGANRVIHGPSQGFPGETPIASCQDLLQVSRIVFNVQGRRQSRGLSLESFRATHVDATRRLVEQLLPGTTLVHISSAAVLGRPAPLIYGRGPPAPASFPLSDYAQVKHESEQLAIDMGRQRGLAVVVLRPAVVCATPLDGMLLTMVDWLRHGLLLDLRPAQARHHFCSGLLLGEVARQVAARPCPRDKVTVFTVADPFTVTNQDLREALVRRWGQPRQRIPLPARNLASVLQRFAHVPGLGGRLSGMAQILGGIGMDVEYDVDETFTELGIDKASFGREQTFERVLDDEARLDRRGPPRHVLVVGATGGVGSVLRDQLVARGTRVSVVGRSAVPDFSGWQRTLDVARADWPRLLADAECEAPLDGIVFVAGTGAFGPTSAVPESVARDILELNFWSVAHAATAAAERWGSQRRSGAFVAVLSFAALRGMPLEAHYGASKAAAARFLQALQFEYPHSIRIEAIFPGSIATPFRSRVPHFGVTPADTARGGDPPERAAQAIMDLLDGRSRPRPVGMKAHAIATLDRISPRLYDRLTRHRMRAFVRSRSYPS